MGKHSIIPQKTVQEYLFYAVLHMNTFLEVRHQYENDNTRDFGIG